MAGLTLPPEVLAITISLLDSETLKSSRLANRTLNHLATRDLFRVVSLYDTEKSYQALKSVIQHAELKSHVHKVYLNTVETDYVSELLVSPHSLQLLTACLQQDSDHEDEATPPHAWRTLLPKLADLPDLQSVVLRFDKHCAADPADFVEPAQTMQYRNTVMEWVFAALASLRRPLRELGIQNYQNLAPRSGPTSDRVAKVVSGLRSLRLNVVHERDEAAPENEIEVCALSYLFPS